MAGPVGGLRSRLIRRALYNRIYAGLDGLGWFDSGRQHVPVTFVQKEIDADQEVTPNAIGLADGPSSDTDAETGSTLAEYRLNYYVDIYAESTALGLHLAGDIKDIIQGRFSATLSQTGPEIPVWDFSLATPVELFSVDVVRVLIDKPEFTSGSRPWRAHYYSLAVTLVDAYASEDYQ